MKSIRTAFEDARNAAEIPDLRLHGFRHTAVESVPQAAIMAAAGHHSIPQNMAYTNLQPADVVNAFKMLPAEKMATRWQHEPPLENASVASY